MSESTENQGSEALNTPTDQHGTSTSAGSPSGPLFRWSIVIPVLFVACGVFAGILVYQIYFDGDDLIFSLSRPAIVPAEGRVLYNGEPLTIGYIETQPLDRDLKGSTGLLDKDGKFRLTTPTVSGDVDGAYVGTHKVCAMALEGDLILKPLIPAHYTEMKDTPLRLTVTEDPKKNAFVFELKGDMKLPTRTRPKTDIGKDVRRPHKKKAVKKDASKTSEEKSNSKASKN